MATAHDRAADATGKTTIDPVAQGLDLGAARRGDGLAQRREVRPAQLVGDLGLRADASSVEPTRSVKSTAMFSLAATRPPPSPLGEILGATRDSPRAAAVPVRPDGPGPIPPTAV